MQKEIITLDSFTLIGLTARTNNQNELNPEKSKIAALAEKYYQEQIASQFQHRAQPGVGYAVYTEYASNEHGDYTFFIGEKVNSLSDQNLIQFKSLVIPAGTYVKFTTDAGKMPDVVIGARQAIWKMTLAELGGKRTYIADFEVYDQRAMDPHHTIVDVYIGINVLSNL